MDNASASIDRMLTFRVDGQSFALDADLVREVARMPRISRVPHAPDALLGLANVRGSVIPVLSTARMLDRQASVPTRIIIIDVGERLGLAVDDASQVVDAGRADGATAIDIAGLVARNLPARAERRSRGSGAGAVSLREDSASAETIPLVVFAIGNQEFAMPLAAVDEVLRLPDEIAVMPDSDDVVVGSVAFRGAVLPLLSLRALLALPVTGETPRTRVLVIRIGTHRVGLVVDEMRSIFRVSEAMVDAVPQVLARGQAEARIQAICRLDDGQRLISILAADQIVREDITARLLQGSTGENDMVQADSRAATEQFLLFRIGEEEFGMPIGAVEEVAPLPAKLTPLPKAPAFVLGVMNLRGQVMPVIDQTQRFGGAPSDRAAAGAGRRRVIVARIGDLQAGFVVDAVSEVVQVRADALQPAPDLGNDDTRVFERVASLDDRQRIVLIVNPRELLDRAEQDLLRELGKTGNGRAGTGKKGAKAGS